MKPCVINKPRWISELIKDDWDMQVDFCMEKNIEWHEHLMTLKETHSVLLILFVVNPPVFYSTLDQ